MVNGGNFPMNPNRKPDHASWGHFEEGSESGQWGDIENSKLEFEIICWITAISKQKLYFDLTLFSVENS